MMLPERECKVKGLYGFLIAVCHFLCAARGIQSFCTLIEAFSTCPSRPLDGLDE
jgi:hypothetical protein